MKTIKFKKPKIFISRKMNKKTKPLIIIVSLVLIYTFIVKISSSFSYNMKDYLQERVKKENLLLLKSGFSYLKKDEVDLDNLITIVQNSKEEIIEVNFNIKECTLILSNIVGYVNSNLEEYNYKGYRLDVPVGIVTNNLFLRNLGPKIPIKVEIGDIAMGDVQTIVKDFGINNALIEVYLTVTLTTSILYPFDSISTESSYQALISSKIIAGKVPDFYNGAINSKSSTISLPIDSEM